MKTPLQNFKLAIALAAIGVLNFGTALQAQLTSQTFSYTGNIATFTVPPCVTSITIEARGAQGGDNQSLVDLGGKGAKMVGTFPSTPGQVFNIIVGQRGFNNTGGNAANGAGGGGGGSFVWLNTSTTPMIVAGGGGGSCLTNNGLPAYLGKDGGLGTSGTGSRSDDIFANSPGGANGANGTSVCGSGGKGWIAVLANPAGNPSGNATYGAAGGYGGGGGAGTQPNPGNYLHTAGGGGGYSGGGAGGTDYYHGGGGGGSFNAGTSQVNTASVQSGNGLVVISYSPGAPVIVFPTSAYICQGSSITLTATGVSTYTWLNNNFTGNTISVSPSSNTSYSVTGTNSLGCQQTVVHTVTVSSTPPVLAISNPSSNICLGRTVSLTATGALTYTWTNGVVNGQVFAPSVTNVYTVSGQNGCGTTTGTTAITVAPLPVSVLASPSLVCQGYTSTLTAVAGVTGFTWTPGNIAASSAVVSPTASQIYTMTASDGTCSGTATLQVATKTTPVITAAATSTNICENDVITISANGAGANGTYSWSTNNSTASSFTAAPLIPTSFNVSGTNSLNCTAYGQVVVIVQPAPVLNVSATKTLICSGQSVTLSVAGGVLYNWTGGPSTTNYVVSPTQAYTIYSVVGTHSVNLVCTNTGTIALAVISPSVVYTNSVAICDGQTATLTASGASTYTWNGIPSPSGTQYFSPAVTTVYNLVTNTQSLTTNCPTNYTAQVVVNANPTVTAVLTKTVNVCRGLTNTITANGASTYSWSGTVVGTGSQVVVSPSVTTTYTVIGTTAAGCSSSMTAQARIQNCVGVAEQNLQGFAIDIYPNPNAGEFFVRSNADIQLRLVNSIGQEIRVFKLDATNDYKMDVRDLSNGVYFLMGETSNSKVHQKIIVGK